MVCILIYVRNTPRFLLIFAEGAALLATTVLLCPHQGLKHLYAPRELVHIDSGDPPSISTS